MFPDLFSIGPFTLHTYGLLVAAGFFAGIFVTIKIGRREGLNSSQIMDMGFLLILAAVMGSRLMYVLINFNYYRQNPVDILKIWQGGLVFSGGIVAAVAAMIWYAHRHRISLLKLGDLWAPAASIGQGFGRIGCFMAGCCYGKPTDLGWGVIFSNPHSLAPLGVALHPTQIYSSLSAFLIFTILFVLSSRKAYTGQVFLWFLILHSTARLWIENYRGDNRGTLPGSSMTMTQAVTLCILIGAVIMLLVLKSRNKKRSGGATNGHGPS